MRGRARALAALCIGALALAPAVVSAAAVASSAPNAPVPLTGTFQLTAGECTEDGATNSYFRMIVPTGTANGPYVGNGDSPCDDQTFTPLEAGTDGGLVTGQYQPAPDPAFDGNGNGLADRLTAPAQFFGVAFAASTNPVDPQTETEVPAPTITNDRGVLAGDLSAFAAHWNNQHFNQGAPKPSGEVTGNSALPTGTYDSGSGAFVIEWASQIEGGPFDNFSGVWHLEGRFVPARGGGGGSTGGGQSGGAGTSTTTSAAPPPPTTGSTSGGGSATTTTGPSGGVTPPTTSADEVDLGPAELEPGEAPPVSLDVENVLPSPDVTAAIGPLDLDDDDGGGVPAVLVVIALLAIAAASGIGYRVYRSNQAGGA